MHAMVRLICRVAVLLLAAVGLAFPREEALRSGEPSAPPPPVKTTPRPGPGPSPVPRRAGPAGRPTPPPAPSPIARGEANALQGAIGSLNTDPTVGCYNDPGAGNQIDEQLLTGAVDRWASEFSAINGILQVLQTTK